MSASLLAVVVDCTEPRRQAGFWSQVLSYEVVERNVDEYLVRDPAGLAGSLYFMRVPEPKTEKNRLHLDLVTDGLLTDEVNRLTELGARFVEIRQDPASMENPDTWAVLEDLEGHVFCVSSSSTITGWY